MKTLYQAICDSKNKHLLAVLFDPDKEDALAIPDKIKKVNASMATHIFVGGSRDPEGKTEELISVVKKHTQLPVIIFPGDINQVSSSADAILFLSLISGRNPDYLIEKQVQAVPKLLNTGLEVISTGYMLIESGAISAVERVSKTVPLSSHDLLTITHTAKAGELLGMKMIYLEAGSGALSPISTEIIKAVKQCLNIPLIVGGGLRTPGQLQDAYEAGADLVVVGTAFEQDDTFFQTAVTKHLV